MIFSVSFCICRSYATAGDLKDVPIYDGTLERFDKDKNSGVLSAAVYGISWVKSMERLRRHLFSGRTLLPPTEKLKLLHEFNRVWSSLLGPTTVEKLE
jgi:hypothetical protein